MKKAKKAAKKFRETYRIKGVPTAYELKQIIKQLGFEACGYSESKDKLRETKTFDLAEKKPAFTYARGNKKYVFYDDLLNEVDTERVLAHEIGHLYYNHMHRRETLLDTDVNKEWEANLFAAYLLEPTNYMACIAKWILILLLALVCFTSGVSYSEKTIQVSSQGQVIDYVYITPTGHNYHADNCRYGEDYRNSIPVNRTDAEKHYLPCDLCNPDK